MTKRARPLGRRDFMRASAVGVATVAAARSVPVADAEAPTRAHAADLPAYVGAGRVAPIRPFTLHQVVLGNGLFQEKRDRMKNFIRQYDQRRFLVLFNNNAGRPNPPGVAAPGGWEDGGLLSGHWAGHYPTALAQSNVDQGEQAPWYTQHKIMRGLLDAYTLTGNEQAFEIVRKMAN